MISVGIDVSKGKSTVCFMKLYGAVIHKPFEVQHTEKTKKINALALDGIPTLYSNTPSPKMLVEEAVKVLNMIDTTLVG